MAFHELLLGLLQGLGVIALVSVTYDIVLGSAIGQRRKAFATATIFALGTLGAMLAPMAIAPGILFDLRNVFVMLAAFFGGPLAVCVAVFSGAVFRLWEGGVGAPGGVIGLIVAGLVGLLASRSRNRRLDFPTLTLLGFASALTFAGVFTLPWNTVALVVSEMLFPTVLANTVGIIIAGQIINRHRTRHQRTRQLSEDALTDPLTGLGNRRKFDTNGPRIVDLAVSSGQSYLMMIIDIDHFKRVNDSFGHEAGDYALRHVASIITRNVRKDDLVARYGGEEIAVILLDRDRDGMKAVADRIRLAIAREPAQYEGQEISLTVSIGVRMPENAEEPFWRTFQETDRALYKAKQNGRDRVEMALAA